MKYVLESLDNIVFVVTIWIMYTHVYGISLNLYKEGKENGTIWDKIKGLKLGAIFWGIGITGGNIIYQLMGGQREGIKVVFFLIVLNGFFYSVAVEKKIRTCLWLWLVIFTAMLPIIIIESIVRALGNTVWENDNILYSYILDIIVLFLTIGLYFLDKKTHFSKRVHKKEKYMLFVITAFITFVGLFGFCDVQRLQIGGSEGLALFVYLGLSGFALIMVIRLIAVGTAADRYEELSAMHEKNARETLAFYESYREAQIETRKLRHDMRNHFFCIQMLAKEGKYLEMEKYLENFNDEISHISMEFQTGNDIVDAILNVKYHVAEKRGIEICVEGNVPIMPFVDAMDWCKIFSNAIDNGMEALEQCEVDKKILQIRLKSNEHFFMIHIENLCAKKVFISKNGVRTDKEEQHLHGFGLKNMETALKKYNGELKLACKEETGGYVFVVDMIMPVRHAESVG